MEANGGGFLGAWPGGPGDGPFGAFGAYGKPLAEWCQRPVPSRLSPGWFTCYCGCGVVGVCRHCVPHAPPWVPWRLCEQAERLVASGAFRCQGGWLEAVGESSDDERRE
ncbi:MAG TPA: hypothetical protein VGT44_08050 [Ktedonobacteraceae bacterium]|nr:hypothetical protein [Ktedonobacteraceae bacterium]